MPGAHVGEEKHRAGALRLHLQALGRAAAQPAGDPGQAGTGAGSPRGAEPQPLVPRPSPTRRGLQRPWTSSRSHRRPSPGTSPLLPHAPRVSRALLDPSPSGLPKLPARISAWTPMEDRAPALSTEGPKVPECPHGPSGAQRIPSSWPSGPGTPLPSHAPPPPQAKVARGPLLPRPGPSRGPAPLSCPHSLSSLYHWKSAGGTAMASQRRRAARPRAVRALVTSVMVGGSGEGRGSADSHS